MFGTIAIRADADRGLTRDADSVEA